MSAEHDNGTGNGDGESSLAERAAVAARAELRGDRSKMLGALEQEPLSALARPRRVPDRWSILHHIGPDIDAERDLLTTDLKDAKVVTTVYEVTGIRPTLDARNGEGDPYYTDGEIKISVLVEGCNTRSASVAVLSNPPVVDWKNQAWSVVEKLLLPAPPAANRP